MECISIVLENSDRGLGILFIVHLTYLHTIGDLGSVDFVVLLWQARRFLGWPV